MGESTELEKILRQMGESGLLSEDFRRTAIATFEAVGKATILDAVSRSNKAILKAIEADFVKHVEISSLLHFYLCENPYNLKILSYKNKKWSE